MLRVLGPGHAPGIVPLEYRPDTGRILIAVQVDARLRGFFEDPTHAAFMQTVRLVAHGRCRGMAAGRRGPSGRSRRLVRTGRAYRGALLGVAVRVTGGRAVCGSAATCPRDRCAVDGGSARAGYVDFRRLRPGSISPRARSTGACSGARTSSSRACGSWAAATEPAWRLGPYPVEGGGGFVCEDIRQANYQLEFADDVRLWRQGRAGTRLVGAPFGVPPGTVVEQIFDVE